MASRLHSAEAIKFHCVQGRVKGLYIQHRRNLKSTGSLVFHALFRKLSACHPMDFQIHAYRTDTSLAMDDDNDDDNDSKSTMLLKSWLKV